VVVVRPLILGPVVTKDALVAALAMRHDVRLTGEEQWKALNQFWAVVSFHWLEGHDIHSICMTPAIIALTSSRTGMRATYIVCNYYPSGNYAGQRPY
jgi:hypothetical protein